MATVAQLTGKISLDGMEKAQSGLKDMHGLFGQASDGLLGFIGHAASFAGGMAIFQGVGTAVGFVKDNLGDMLKSGMDANREMDILTQGLKSTHDASGMTAQSLDDLSTKIMNQTGIDDDATKAAEQMLLTFTGIGKDAFPAATQAAADMATRMNGGAIPSAQQMQQQALLLGKALNDPAQGLTALTREGVTFSDQQKEQIKHMVAVGDTAGAQKIMIAELNKEFGGSAQAAGQANGGMAILSAQFDNMKQSVGQAIVPLFTQLMSVLTPLTGQLASALPGAISTVQGIFQQWAPVIQTIWSYLKDFGYVLLQDIQPGLASLGKAFSQLQGPGDTTKGVLQQIVSIGQSLYPVIDQVGKIFNQLSAWFLTVGVPAIKQFSDFVQGTLVPLLAQVGEFILTTVVPALGQLATWVIQNVLPAIYQLVGWFREHVLPILETLITVIVTNVLPALEGIAHTVLTQLVPSLENLWNKLSPVLIPAFQLLGGILQNVVGPAISTVIGFVSNLIDFIANLIGKIGDVLGALGNFKDAAGNAIKSVNNVPILGGIASHFGFAQGGIIPEPVLGVGLSSGASYSFAENGPEMVTPNGGFSGGGGSGQPIAVTIPVYLGGRQVGQAVLPDLVAEIRRATGLRI